MLVTAMYGKNTKQWVRMHINTWTVIRFLESNLGKKNTTQQKEKRKLADGKMTYDTN